MVASVKLNTEAFSKLTEGISDIELSKMMGISTTQLWRVRLPDDDPRHNDPGIDFVAGILRAFPDKTFEDLFLMAEPLRPRNVVTDHKISTGTEG